MLQLLAPFALLGLATLAIPALLHLWRPPAETVRVGTLGFFSGPAVRRLNKLRWRERLLLLVRLLLLACLVLLLSRPIWKRDATRGARRWALLEPNAILGEDAAKRWRELKASGFEMRWMESGFPRVSDLARSNRAGVDLWSLLREANARLGAGSKIAVFASDQLRSLHGDRLALPKNRVEWISPTPPNESETIVWIESVSPGTEGELAVQIGSSNTRLTSHTSFSVPDQAGQTALPAPLQSWKLELRGDHAARLLGPQRSASDSSWVNLAKLAPLRVAVLASSARDEDARYLRAALQSIGRPIELSSETKDAAWVFWLNDQSAPEQLQREIGDRGANLFSDAAQSANFVSEPRGVIDLPTPIPIARRTTSAATRGVPFWTDGFGNSILTVERAGRGYVWNFFSRFHPEWNDLSQSSALPVALRELLIVPPAPPTHDLRQVDASQGRPAESEDAADFRLTSPPETLDLRQLLWWICAALFLFDRALSLSSIPKPAGSSR